MFIVLADVNAYDQEGSYFVAAYPERPTEDQINELLSLNQEEMDRLMAGEGTLKFKRPGDTAYSLVEVTPGQRFF